MCSVEIRTYRPEDDPGIASLFETCFGHRLSPEHWQWKYARNPYGNGHIMVGLQNGRIIAQYAGYPVFLDDGSGNRVRAFHLGDIMTEPGIRGDGVGKRSIIARVTEAFYGEFCTGKVAFNFGVPSAKHMRLGELLLRYRRMGPVLLWTRSGAIASANRKGWSGAFSRLKTLGCRLEEPSGVTEDASTLYEDVKNHLGLSICRDTAYLKWRYGQSPSKAYRFFQIRRRGRLALWAVVSVEKHAVLIGDVLVAPEESFLFQMVIDRLIDQYPDLPFQMWGLESREWWNRMLADAEFSSQPHPSNIWYAIAPFDPAFHDHDAVNQKWFRAMGDFDLF